MWSFSHLGFFNLQAVEKACSSESLMRSQGKTGVPFFSQHSTTICQVLRTWTEFVNAFTFLPLPFLVDSIPVYVHVPQFFGALFEYLYCKNIKWLLWKFEHIYPYLYVKARSLIRRKSWIVWRSWIPPWIGWHLCVFRQISNTLAELLSWYNIMVIIVVD